LRVNLKRPLKELDAEQVPNPTGFVEKLGLRLRIFADAYLAGVFDCASSREHAQDCEVRRRPTLAELPAKMMADDGTDDILGSIKEAQRNALLERAWKSRMKKCDMPA
jgi:hypothetical protein